MALPKNLFVTGTDTGIGKTVVTAAISNTMKLSGKKVSVMKPIQTGTLTQKVLDIEFVYKVLDEEFNIDVVCPYRFDKPLSPKLASHDSSVDINIDNIMSSYRTLTQNHDHVIVEGAGGILVPIKENYFISNLIAEMDIPIVIVSRANLGTINHTLLTIEFARSMGISIIGVIINNFPLHPNEAELSNPHEISAISGLPILGIIPELNNLSVENGEIGNFSELSNNYICTLFGGNFVFSE